MRETEEKGTQKDNIMNTRHIQDGGHEREGKMNTITKRKKKQYRGSVKDRSKKRPWRREDKSILKMLKEKE